MSLGLLLLALALSALFAGSETGYYAMNPLRLRLQAGRSRWAAVLARVVRPPSAFLTMLLVGNNVANDLAVFAGVSLVAAAGIEQPEIWATLMLTPLVFLFGEVAPKQIVLGDPLRLLLGATPLLGLFRLLLLPVTAPIVGLAHLFSREDAEAIAGRRHLAALLLEGGRHPSSGTAPVLVAALRALQSQGKGLQPFLRRDLPLLYANIPLADARIAIAHTRDALALLDRPGRPPGLLLGTHLVLAEPGTAPSALALDLPVLPPDLDLAEALTELRDLGRSFALVGEVGEVDSVLDLEYALSLLLSRDAGVTHA